ncbi:hypothetical protein BZA77DRAFT_372208 [Pyronema omphalodes]|nr:hypothetical protein BZA77DRAFT_372208 [Pyronema omphalodes]
MHPCNFFPFVNLVLLLATDKACTGDTSNVIQERGVDIGSNVYTPKYHLYEVQQRGRCKMGTAPFCNWRDIDGVIGGMPSPASELATRDCPTVISEMTHQHNLQLLDDVIDLIAKIQILYKLFSPSYDKEDLPRVMIDEIKTWPDVKVLNNEWFGGNITPDDIPEVLQPFVDELVSFDTSDRTEEEKVQDAVEILPAYLFVVYFVDQDKMEEVLRSLDSSPPDYDGLEWYGQYSALCGKNMKEGQGTMESSSDINPLDSKMNAESSTVTPSGNIEESSRNDVGESSNVNMDDINSYYNNRTAEDCMRQALQDLSRLQKMIEDDRRDIDSRVDKHEKENGFPSTTYKEVKTDQNWKWEDEDWVTCMLEPVGCYLVPNYPFEVVEVKSREELRRLIEEDLDKKAEHYKIRETMLRSNPVYQEMMRKDAEKSGLADKTNSTDITREDDNADRTKNGVQRGSIVRPLEEEHATISESTNV